MIGAKSITALTFAAAALPAAALRGRFDPAYLAGLSAASALTIGLFAGACGALLMTAWRPHAPSRVGLGAGAARDLPAPAQRALVTAALAGIGLAVFGNATTARLIGVPAALAEPSHSAYCPPPEPEKAEAPAPVVVEVPEQPGCALVKRAFELGYAKSLGSCAPQKIEQHVEEVKAAIAPCNRRKLDEPFLHFAWRRMSEHGASLGDLDPVRAVSHRADTMQTKVDHLDVLIGRLLHAVGGSPHAAHHIWINLPDPHPSSWLSRSHCDERYQELDAWPDATTPSALVENVLGNLLFSTRFGKPPASCRDVQVHWNAPDDACARLVADPTRAPGVHDVLDRRRRQLEARALADTLGEETPIPEPPAAAFVVSLSCLLVDPSGLAKPTTSVISIDGESLEVRELRIPSIDTDGAGPIALYTALAELLATGPYTGPAADDAALPRATAPPTSPADLSTDFLLTRLDALEDADPFLGATWPLDRPDLRDVYPFHRHLLSFIDSFRRRYRATRGRL